MVADHGRARTRLITRLSHADISFVIILILYSIIFFCYYPPISGIDDEIGFLNQAWVWSKGALSSEAAGLSFVPFDFIEVGGRHVPARHPGRSLVALPFLLVGGARAVFLSGLALHLVTALCGASLLVKLGRSPLWAVLLLFHPTLAIYSRTVMADGASGMALLIAASATVSGRPVAAGLWVGVAAAMRYHAGLALPLVVASLFSMPRGGTPRRPLLDAASCSVAGLAAGGTLVAYNLLVYGAPNEPFTMRRGWFSSDFLAPNLLFYETCLMLIWPGMLLAPLLDRSRLRWLTRGSIAIFLGPLLFYYFHDRTPGWLETQVVGQRLIQVALPLWVVAYAGVVDDLIGTPLLGLLGKKAVAVLVAVACFGLVTSNIVASSRHQEHLRELAFARDSLATLVPAGSLIVYEGAVYKLAIAPDGEQVYRTLHLATDDRPTSDPTVSPSDLDGEARPWFMVVLKRSPDTALSSGCVEVIRRYDLEPVQAGSPLLAVYHAPQSRQGPANGGQRLSFPSPPLGLGP